MRTIKELQSLFPGTAATGLSAVAVDQSRHRFGSNRLTPVPREPLWKKFLEKFDEPIIKILLAAALLSMIVELFKDNAAIAGVAVAALAGLLLGTVALRKPGWLPPVLLVSALALFLAAALVPPHHPSVEGLAVMVAVVLATGVAFLSEYKSDREFEVLNAQNDTSKVKVLRGGDVHAVELEDVVVGDLVLLEMGDEVPADGRLIKSTELLIDQSLMTGESEAVRKLVQPPDDNAEGPEQPGCLYRGTQVVDGVGHFLVAEVGDATALGQIARQLSATGDERATSADSGQTRVRHKLTISKELTPLQLKLKNLAEQISKIGYCAAAAIFLALLIRGLWVGEVRWQPTGDERLPDVLLASGNALLNYFVYMVIVIVVAVPEGLPMSVTVSLALAMKKMTRANSLVRQLVACETIGSATVICSDKTGTLTQNKMQVQQVFWDGTLHTRGSANWIAPQAFAPDTQAMTPLDWVVLNAAVNATANLEQKGGKLLTIGNSTEGSLLHWLHEGGQAYTQLRLQHECLYQIHFSSERKRMTSVTRLGNRLVVLVKGAPERLLGQSTQFLSSDGLPRPWTNAARDLVAAALRDAASLAMRTLAFGHAVLPEGACAEEDALHAQRDVLEANLVFDCFVAIRDPLREDVKDAMVQCRTAGIAVKMITGDNVETARAIAFDIGLVDSHDAAIDTDAAVVLTSPVFNAWHDRLKALEGRGGLTAGEIQERAMLAERLANLRVLARARPLDKYKMVDLLQERQQVVAVTGDGTNDAPALKKADVGLAMGIAGTEVAKEASKIVLLDDAFATIVKAVHWGRALYENIQRFLQFQLTINVSALTIAFLGPFIGLKPPFTVLQLLWINVIMDTLASIALCSEPPRPGLLSVPPKRRDESIVSPTMVTTIFTTAAFFVVVMMTLLAGMKWFGWFSGQEEATYDATELNVRQVSIFFTLYVFFQVWNQINCRSLVPEESGLKGLFQNPTFLTVAAAVAGIQVLIVNVPFLAAFFKVEPLGWFDWLAILAGSASVLVFGEVVRRIRMAAA